MGFLSTATVIECTSTELIGEYVGHTAPKTRKLLQKALGKLLVINKVNALKNSNFGKEALDEISQFISHPSHIGKIVTIITGTPTEIDGLMTFHPSLRQLFLEEIRFKSLSSESCITLLVRELESRGGYVEGDVLQDSISSEYRTVKEDLHMLQKLPGWANATDIKELARAIIRKSLSTSKISSQGMTTDMKMQRLQVSYTTICACVRELIESRQDLSFAGQLESIRRSDHYDDPAQIEYLIKPPAEAGPPSTQKQNIRKMEHTDIEDSPDSELDEEAIQEMEVCVAGYPWHRVAGGYQCEGGSHFVSLSLLI